MHISSSCRILSVSAIRWNPARHFLFVNQRLFLPLLKSHSFKVSFYAACYVKTQCPVFHSSRLQSYSNITSKAFTIAPKCRNSSIFDNRCLPIWNFPFHHNHGGHFKTHLGFMFIVCHLDASYHVTWIPKPMLDAKKKFVPKLIDNEVDIF